MKQALASVTLSDLREAAAEEEYDWENEVMPHLAQIREAIVDNLEAATICRLALVKVVGRPRTRARQAQEKKSRWD